MQLRLPAVRSTRSHQPRREPCSRPQPDGLRKARRCRQQSLPRSSFKLDGIDLGSLARQDAGFLVAVEGCLCDATPITAALAWSAANALWPDVMCGSPQVFTSYLRQILPAVASLPEAVLLMRVLVEEGVVGARSTAGREGPVVGRNLRLYGSRPLLPTEIMEHWDLVKDTCLLRWQAPNDEPLTDRVGDCLRSSMHSGGLVVSDPSLAAAADGVVPHQPVVEAVKGAYQRVHLVSAYSPEVADLLLGRVGLQQLPVACLREVPEVVARVEELRQQHDVLHVLVGSVPLAEALARGVGPGAGGAAAQGAVRVWVADWGLPTAGLQAKVKRMRGVELLSQTQLADIMGVTHLRVVMDGIPWE